MLNTSISGPPAVVKSFAEHAARVTRPGNQASGLAEPPAAVVGVSNPKAFADMLIRGVGGPWAADAEGAGVYRWTGTHWGIVHTLEGQRIAAKWLSDYRPDDASTGEARDAWTFASLMLGSVRPLPKLTERVVIPCEDVYLEIRSDGSVIAIDPDPELGLTYCVAIKAGTSVGQEHHPRALPANSAFREWLTEAQPEADVRSLIQEQCGMTLLPHCYQIATWWWGEAGSGKSTLAELVAKTQRSVAAVNLHALDSSRFALEGLLGASLVRVEEVGPKRWCEETWKSLVSGNAVAVERKHIGGSAVLSSTAKWIITSNNAPFVTDSTNGVWRRMCAIRWTRVVPERKKVIGFHNWLLKHEGRAILDWLLDGAIRIRRRGKFLSEGDWPASVRTEKADTRADSDSVTAWIDAVNARPVTEDKEWRSKDAIYASYETYCAAAHREPITREAFWRGIKHHPAFSGQLKKYSNRRVIVGSETKCLYHANIRFDLPGTTSTAEVIESPFSQKGFDFGTEGTGELNRQSQFFFPVPEEPDEPLPLSFAGAIPCP